METRRIILYAALALIGLSLWNAWQVDYPPQQTTATENSAPTQSSSEDRMLPEVGKSSANEDIKNPEQTKQVTNSSSLIHIKTDVLDIAIDPKQGTIVSGLLLNYPVSTEEKNTPFPLLQEKDQEKYVANSGLFVVKDQKPQFLDFAFTSEQSNYQMSPDQNELRVVLNGNNEDGLSVQKIFTFSKGSYLIDVEYKIKNKGSDEWKGFLNTQLERSSPKEDKSSIFHVGSYTGASLSNPGVNRFQKISFAQMQKGNLNLDAKGGWVAMQQHYFLTAWIPNANSTNKFYTRAFDNNYSIGTVSEPIVIAADQEKNVSARLYVGPENTSVLKEIAPSLDLTVDYGMLWFLSSLLFSLMKSINNFVGNWGWSIVLVTVLIKLAFYRLSAASYKSMAGMRKLQPKLLALRERYGDDKVKISQATMELYKQEKINPLGGCLPIVIQIPVFIALYWVLLESVELRQAPFIFWIKDLASADPLHVLPIIMGATMLVQQKLNPAPPDPVQARVMMLLPFLFTALFWNFPSGLVLYWIVNNTLSIAQQWYITRKYADDKPVKKMVVSAK